MLPSGPIQDGSDDESDSFEGSSNGEGGNSNMVSAGEMNYILCVLYSNHSILLCYTMYSSYRRGMHVRFDAHDQTQLHNNY